MKAFLLDLALTFTIASGLVVVAGALDVVNAENWDAAVGGAIALGRAALVAGLAASVPRVREWLVRHQPKREDIDEMLGDERQW